MSSPDLVRALDYLTCQLSGVAYVRNKAEQRNFLQTILELEILAEANAGNWFVARTTRRMGVPENLALYRSRGSARSGKKVRDPHNLGFIVFRGTTNVLDVLTDAHVEPIVGYHGGFYTGVTEDEELMAVLGALGLIKPRSDASQSGRVSPEPSRAISKIENERASRNLPTDWIFTGHSLGAGKAEVAMRIVEADNQDRIRGGRTLSVETIGFAPPPTQYVKEGSELNHHLTSARESSSEITHFIYHLDVVTRLQRSRDLSKFLENAKAEQAKKAGNALCQGLTGILSGIKGKELGRHLARAASAGLGHGALACGIKRIAPRFENWNHYRHAPEAFTVFIQPTEHLNSANPAYRDQKYTFRVLTPQDVVREIHLSEDMFKELVEFMKTVISAGGAVPENLPESVESHKLHPNYSMAVRQVHGFGGSDWALYERNLFKAEDISEAGDGQRLAKRQRTN